jgi:NADPH:quinone reductase-like Zn-dependent oxidoreductase
MQIANAAGLKTIITSSSDKKLERARSLGARHTINYLQTPDWDVEAQKLTGGAGVDLVVEVGGAGTIEKSLVASKRGGTLAIIGGLSGFAGTGLQPGALIFGAKRVHGILVGSTGMLKDVNALVEATKLDVAIGETIPFGRAADAFVKMEQGSHFGKLVITNE